MTVLGSLNCVTHRRTGEALPVHLLLPVLNHLSHRLQSQVSDLQDSLGLVAPLPLPNVLEAAAVQPHTQVLLYVRIRLVIVPLLAYGDLLQLVVFLQILSLLLPFLLAMVSVCGSIAVCMFHKTWEV